METQRRQTRGRHLLLGLTVIALTVTVLAVVLEVSLRLAGDSNPRMSQRDDNRGTARIPGIELVYTDEGFGHVRINSAGFRDDEWAVPKPDETLRVAILGDSYVEALQVEKEERFAEVAERLLEGSAAAGGRDVEVMSFGVSGYGTAQELMTLRHHVWQYSPDLVVLAITPTNDVRNNLEALEQDDGRPYFRYVNGELVLDDSFRQSAGHNRGISYDVLMGLADRSRLVDFSLRTVRSVLSRASRQRQIEQAGVAGGFEDEAGLDVWIYAEPQDDLKREAWRVTEGVIELMNQEVRAHDSNFLAVILTSGRQVDPDATRREAFMQRLGVTDLFYPERRIRALGERAGFAVLALAPPLQEFAERNGMALHGFRSGRSSGHWNGVGHREAGRLLAEKIASMWTKVAPAATDQ